MICWQRSSAFALLVAVPSLLAVASPAAADVFECADGRVVRGGLVGEAQGELTLLDEDLHEVVLARADVTHVQQAPVSDRLARKLEQARVKFVREREKAVKKALQAYGRAAPEERPALAAALAGEPEAALLEPLGKALDDRRSETRALARERLAALGSEAATWRLVRAGLTTDRPEDAAALHQAAVTANPDFTRRAYEGVAAAPTKPARRLAALARVKALHARRSVPGLIGVLEHVDAELRATLATAGGLRRIPLNLGTRGQAAIDAPIELPEMQLTEVAANVGVSTLRTIRDAALDALRAVAGEDRGDDPALWRTWWAQQPDAQEPESRTPGATDPRPDDRR